jgi:hypothetical protein
MVIEKYFACDLYSGLSRHRKKIQEYARQRYSWDVVSELTESVYEELLGKPLREKRGSAHFLLS